MYFFLPFLTFELITVISVYRSFQLDQRGNSSSDETISEPVLQHSRPVNDYSLNHSEVMNQNRLNSSQIPPYNSNVNNNNSSSNLHTLRPDYTDDKKHSQNIYYPERLVNNYC